MGRRPARSKIARVQRAVRDRWEFPEGARKFVANEMIRIAVSRDKQTDEPLHDPRVRIAATRALIAMHHQNQLEKQATQQYDYHRGLNPQQQRARLSAIAQKLEAGGVAAHAGQDNASERASENDRTDPEDRTTGEPG